MERGFGIRFSSVRARSLRQWRGFDGSWRRRGRGTHSGVDPQGPRRCAQECYYATPLMHLASHPSGNYAPLAPSPLPAAHRGHSLVRAEKRLLPWPALGRATSASYTHLCVDYSIRHDDISRRVSLRDLARQNGPTWVRPLPQTYRFGTGCRESVHQFPNAPAPCF